MTGSQTRDPSRGAELAIFLPSLAGGGAERMMLNLARGMLELGLSVDLVVASSAGPYGSLVPQACTLIDLGASRILSALPGLLGYLRRRRPQALLSAMDHANLVALWARAMARAPTRVYVSVRSTLSREARESQTLAGRSLPYLASVFYPRAQAVIAVSQGVAEDLERLIGPGRARVLVIPNPVVTSEIPELAAVMPDHRWANDPYIGVILAAGRLAPQKDFPTLIRAFAALGDRPDLRLIILGEGPERPALTGLVQDLGLGGRVDLPGFVDNIFAYMARARVFALSSAWEGLPGVLIQAMACGTPVVSTDCPSGPREILEHGRLGALVPVGDVQAMAAAMARTLDQPPDSKRLKARAADFEVTTVTRRYLDVLGLHPTGAMREA